MPARRAAVAGGAGYAVRPSNSRCKSAFAALRPGDVVAVFASTETVRDREAPGSYPGHPTNL
jgi:hypothetical protein